MFCGMYLSVFHIANDSFWLRPRVNVDAWIDCLEVLSSVDSTLSWFSDSKLCECECVWAFGWWCAWQPEDRIVVILLLNAQMETDDFAPSGLISITMAKSLNMEREREREGWRETNIWRSNLFRQSIHRLQYKSNTHTTPICKAARGVRMVI